MYFQRGTTKAEKPLSPGKRAFTTETMHVATSARFEQHLTTKKPTTKATVFDSSNGTNSTNELINEAETIEKRFLIFSIQFLYAFKENSNPMGLPYQSHYTLISFFFRRTVVLFFRSKFVFN